MAGGLQSPREGRHSTAGAPREPQPRAVPRGTVGAGTKGTGCSAKMQWVRSLFPFHSGGTFAPIVSCLPGLLL